MTRFHAEVTGRRLLLVAGICLVVVARPVSAGEIPPAPSAEPQATGELGTNDPLETINRFTSGFNSVLRGVVVDPLVDGYQAVTPISLQNAISNAVSNITEPLTIGSSLLQGDTENASTATKRFFINTTLGLGGTSDPATDMGLVQRREDLGQAFGASGMAPGPHLVLPLLGPTNFRDATGDVISAVVSPLPLAAKAATSGVSYSNNQDEIQDVTSGALDPYIVERESYEQNRRYEVTNGVVPLVDFPEFAVDEKTMNKTR